MRQAFSNGLIEDDMWLEMLKIRNRLSHDYDGSLAKEQFCNIINEYYPLFDKLKHNVSK